MATRSLFASINSGCSWLDEHIKSFVIKYSPNVIFTKDLTSVTNSEAALFQICDGLRHNTNDFIIPLNNPNSSLINVYPNTDFLTRKNYLSKTIKEWETKRPESILKRHVPLTIWLNLDYADCIDESLAEADSFELCESLEANKYKEPCLRDWWILKPAITNCGDGIQIFSTMTDLEEYLEPTELDRGETPPIETDHHIPCSQLREFVAQKYLTSLPLLDGKKFHIRAYVLAIGRLQIFVYRELMVLIASEAYRQPWDNPSLKSSLTNQSLRSEGLPSDYTRKNFWSSIPDDILPGDWKENAFQQICQISAETFHAASQTVAGGHAFLPGCFELFALDFLIDTKGAVWLLEVNAGPAIPQEGEAGSLVLGLFESITYVTLGKLIQMNNKPLEEKGMIEVLNSKLSKSNIREIIY